MGWRDASQIHVPKGVSPKNPEEQSCDHCRRGTPEHGEDTGSVETKLMAPASESHTRLVRMLILPSESRSWAGGRMSY